MRHAGRCLAWSAQAAAELQGVSAEQIKPDMSTGLIKRGDGGRGVGGPFSEIQLVGWLVCC